MEIKGEWKRVLVVVGNIRVVIYRWYWTLGASRSRIAMQEHTRTLTFAQWFLHTYICTHTFAYPYLHTLTFAHFIFIYIHLHTYICLLILAHLTHFKIQNYCSIPTAQLKATLQDVKLNLRTNSNNSKNTEHTIFSMLDTKHFKHTSLHRFNQNSRRSALDGEDLKHSHQQLLHDSRSILFLTI